MNRAFERSGEVRGQKFRKHSPEIGASRYNLGLLLAVFGYIAVLHVSYKELFAPAYSYQGFTYRSVDDFRYGFAILLVAVVAFALPRRIAHVSDMVLWILFLGGGAPAILVGQYANVISTGEATMLGMNVAACLLLARFLARLRPGMHLDVSVRDLSQYFPVVCAGFTAGIFAYLAATGNLSFRFLALYDVYDVRLDFMSRNQGDLVTGYLAPAQFYVIGPLTIALGLYHRRFGVALLGIACQVILYASIGHKTILFSTLGVLGLWMLFSARQFVTGKRILFWTAASSWFLVVIDLFLGEERLADLIVRRFMIVPGVLASAYFSVFNDAPKTNFGDVLPFVSSAYHASASYVVGDQFFGSSSADANASLWMHGFASAGYLGMYLETLILVLLLWLADDATKGLPLFLACAVFLMPAVAVGESSIFTAFLTHGFLAALIVSALLPRSETEAIGQQAVDEPVRQGRVLPRKRARLNTR